MCGLTAHTAAEFGIFNASFTAQICAYDDIRSECWHELAEYMRARLGPGCCIFRFEYMSARQRQVQDKDKHLACERSFQGQELITRQKHKKHVTSLIPMNEPQN